MASLSRRKLAARAAERIASGHDKTKVMQEIAAYLIDSKRTNEAELIVRDIEATLANSGTVVASVTSARELSNESLKQIESYVSNQFTDVQRVILKTRIDESLIGGVKVSMPGKSLDASVKAKLDKLTV